MREKPNRIQKRARGIIRPASVFLKYTLCLFVSLFMVAVSMAENVYGENEKMVVKENTSDAKELSGMSIIGNDEAPKSLYIVPWKSSEIGEKTSLNAMLNEKDVPVDVEVLKRQQEFYRISTDGKIH
ncbi:MAG: hypothetical protein ABFS03_04605 [Chloroflexota bacterium]